MTARETNLVNAFETTLAAQLASGGTTINLTDDPGVDAPVYLVIDPDNDSNREVILWSSGTNHAAATVTRDIDSKHGTDPTHAAGTQVRLAVVKQHIEEAHDAIQQGFILEDDDGTEVEIKPAVASGVYTAREVKFIGDGVDIDWTDVTDGTDGDPYDLTFTVDASQAITALTGGDLTLYEDANNADVSFKMGTSATEALSIEVLNGGSNKTAEEIKIKTSTASATGNHGKISIYIDDAEIMDIDDGGIDMASGKTVAINGTDLPTSGGKVLQVVTALDTGDTTATTSTSYVDTNLGATITPANSSNKILVFANQIQSFSPTGGERISMSAIERSISGGADTVIHEKFMQSSTSLSRHPTATFIHLDSPSTTSATTYKIQSKIAGGAFRHNENADATIDSSSSTGTMTLVEIEG